MFLLINYILSNEFVLDYEWLYFINWCNDTDRGKTEELGEKPVKFLLSTLNLTWTALGSNPRLRRERTTTNRLSHGTALKD